jgi:ferredoxin-NADP reductase
MLAGGSGITPLMSMLRDLGARGAVEDTVLVAYTRGPDDVIFGRELAALAARHPGLRVLVKHGLFDAAELAAAVPDLARRRAFLCGPAPMMALVEKMWTDAGIRDRLALERFVLAVAPSGATGSRRVTLATAGRAVETDAATTLLVGLEQAGERPAYGCRMGICGTCKTRKKTGAVTNVMTGVTSSDPDEDIQLCISTPCSDVELAL